MKSIYHSLTLLMIYSNCIGQTDIRKTSKGFVISNVNVVNIESGLVGFNAEITVEDQIVLDISTRSKPSNDISNSFYAIPGLWDMHVHVTDAKKMILPVLVAHGITAVRDMGGDLNYLNRITDDLDLVTPIIFKSGPYLDGNKPGLPYRVILEDEQSAINAIDSLLTLKIDFVKIHNLVPRESYFALAKYCEEKDLALTGHIPVEVSPYEAVQSNQKSIEHATTLFEGTFASGYASQLEMFNGVQDFVHEGYDSLAKLMVKHGTFFTPNLVATDTRANKAYLAENPGFGSRYIPKSLALQWDSYFPISEKDRDETVIRYRKLFSELMKELTINLHSKGVKVLAASDLALRDIYPGSSLHDELSLMVEAGLTPQQALRTATLEPAKFFNIENQYGDLATGKKANLILLRGNPLDNIDNIRQIEAVVLNGRIFTKEEIEKLLNLAAEMSPKY